MRQLNVVLFGLTGLGNSALKALLDLGCNVACLVTRRESGSFPYYPETTLSSLAREAGVPVHEDPDYRSSGFADILRSYHPELLLVGSYHKIIPRSLLGIPTWCVNLHPSLLPKYRSRTPITWAIANGETTTGITAHLISDVVDGGPIVAQKSIVIDVNDTDGTLRQKLAIASGGLVAEVVSQVSAGDLKPVPQKENEATQFPPRSSEVVTVTTEEYGESPLETHNFVRGHLPFPGVRLLDRRIVSTNFSQGRVVIATEDGNTLKFPLNQRS